MLGPINQSQASVGTNSLEGPSYNWKEALGLGKQKDETIGMLMIRAPMIEMKIHKPENKGAQTITVHIEQLIARVPKNSKREDSASVVVSLNLCSHEVMMEEK